MRFAFSLRSPITNPEMKQTVRDQQHFFTEDGAVHLRE